MGFLYFCGGFICGKLVALNMGTKDLFTWKRQIGNYELEYTVGIPWGWAPQKEEEDGSVTWRC